MQATLLILPIAVPLIFWGAYHYHKDRHLPEPTANLIVSFCLGLGAAALSKLMYIGLEPFGLRYDAFELGATNPLGLFAFTMLAIGPIEELAKLLPFVLVVLRFKAFDEPLDGIIYASFIGLGYSAAENFHYLDFLTPIESAARGFAGPVVHMLFASIWAYWIGRARLGGTSITWSIICGFVIAAGLHGAYDFLVILQPVLALPIAAAMILTIWIWRLKLMRKMHRDAVMGVSKIG